MTKENFLKEIREKRGLTPSELARRAGISKQSLNGFEKKRHGVSNEVLLKLADVLEVKMDEIVPGKYPPYLEKGRRDYLKAIKLSDKYYEKEKFDEELMVDIATELHNFLISFDSEEKTAKIALLRKDMHRKICQGLAAKCFLNFLDTEKLD